MRDCARALAQSLDRAGVPIFAADRGFTTSHQFAVEAARYGGGQSAAKLLRKANLLTSGIGLPGAAVADDMNGLRFGTPEIVRWGMQTGQRGVGVITPSNIFDKYTEFLRAGSAGDYIRANGLDRLPWVKRTMEHPAYDAYWQGQDLARVLAARPSTVPTLWTQGLWDQEDMASPSMHTRYSDLAASAPMSRLYCRAVSPSHFSGPTS